MTTTAQAPKTMEELVERYNRAWGDHDLDGILSLHTPDSGWRVHGVNGIMIDVKGIDACREAFGMVLAAIPDQAFDSTELVIREDYYVCHHTVTGTFATPFALDGTVYDAIGKPVEFEIVDIMECEGNLVKQKGGWLDGLAVYRQLEAAVA